LNDVVGFASRGQHVNVDCTTSLAPLSWASKAGLSGADKTGHAQSCANTRFVHIKLSPSQQHHQRPLARNASSLARCQHKAYHERVTCAVDLPSAVWSCLSVGLKFRFCCGRSSWSFKFDGCSGVPWLELGSGSNTLCFCAFGYTF